MPAVTNADVDCRVSGAVAVSSNVITERLGDHPSARVRAAAVVDRWIAKHFEDLLGIGDGELFELAFALERDWDRLRIRPLLALRERLYSSPFERVRKEARKRWLGN